MVFVSGAGGPSAGRKRYLEMADDSHKKPESDKKYEPRRRKCLRCQESFTSAWPGERVCSPCKQTSDWRDGIAA